MPLSEHGTTSFVDGSTGPGHAGRPEYARGAGGVGASASSADSTLDPDPEPEAAPLWAGARAAFLRAAAAFSVVAPTDEPAAAAPFASAATASATAALAALAALLPRPARRALPSLPCVSLKRMPAANPRIDELSADAFTAVALCTGNNATEGAAIEAAAAAAIDGTEAAAAAFCALFVCAICVLQPLISPHTTSISLASSMFAKNCTIPAPCCFTKPVHCGGSVDAEARPSARAQRRSACAMPTMPGGGGRRDACLSSLLS